MVSGNFYFIISIRVKISSFSRIYTVGIFKSSNIVKVEPKALLILLDILLNKVLVHTILLFILDILI